MSALTLARDIVRDPGLGSRVKTSASHAGPPGATQNHLEGIKLNSGKLGKTSKINIFNIVLKGVALGVRGKFMYLLSWL